MREPDLKGESGWPSGKLRLTLLISFGGLLARRLRVRKLG